MGIVRFGGGVAEIRGSVGGTVFSRSKAGATCRQRVKPVDPRSELMQDRRSAVSQIAGWWHSELTWLQRAAWNTLGTTTTFYNRLGEPYNPSGFELFCRANGVCKYGNELHGVNPYTIVDDPPTSATLSAPTYLLRQYGTPSYVQIRTQSAAPVTNFGVVVQLKYGLNSGVYYDRGPYSRRAVAFAVGTSYVNVLQVDWPAGRTSLRIRGYGYEPSDVGTDYGRCEQPQYRFLTTT